MAQVILQVLLEVEDAHEAIGDDLQSAVYELLTESLPELCSEYGVQNVSVVFEDVV